MNPALVACARCAYSFCRKWTQHGLSDGACKTHASISDNHLIEWNTFPFKRFSFMKCLLCNLWAHNAQHILFDFMHFHMKFHGAYLSNWENDFYIAWFMEIFPYIISHALKFIGKVHAKFCVNSRKCSRILCFK